MVDIEKLKVEMKSSRKKNSDKKNLSVKNLLSTGSTLLNLACTDRPYGALAKGHCCNLVGDSQSGKTFLAHTLFAEATLSKHFKKYRFIYDDTEGGAMMNLKQMFGREVAERREAPRYVDGMPISSETAEQFYFHVHDALKKGKPFIYVLDSMDALTTEQEQKKFKESKRASRKGTEAKGDYGDAKAKINSRYLRAVVAGLKETGSILIISSQTRDNLGFGFQKKTRSGGHALDFYPSLIIWTSIKKRIKKTIRGRERKLGIVCRAQVAKNRYTGKLREVEFPIYYSIGVDDIGSCVDYLIDEGVFQAKRGTSIIKASDLDLKGTRDKLIKQIEENGYEKDLQVLTAQRWQEVESAMQGERKRRYE